MSVILYMSCFSYSILMTNVFQTYEKKHRLLYGRSKKEYGFIWCLCASFICYFPIMLVYGLRSENVGVDTRTYTEYYHWFEEFKLSQIASTIIEPGYVFINVIAKRLFNSVVAVHFICGIIILSVFLYAINFFYKEINMGFATFIFFMTLYAISCNQVRQSMAVCIVLISYRYLENKKIIKFFLLILIAMLFHKTALIAIISYIIFWGVSDKNKWKFRLILCLISIATPLISVVIQGVLDNMSIYGQYTAYLLNEFNIKELTFFCYVVPELLIFTLLEWFQIENEEKTRNEKFVNVFWVEIVFQMSQTIWPDLLRMGYYFMFVRLLCVPLLLSNIVPSKRKNMYILVTIWYLVFYIVFFIIQNGHATYPYEIR